MVGYQLEIFARPEARADATRPEEAFGAGVDPTVLLGERGPATGDYVTGALVPGAETALAPTPPMRARLQPGDRYFWRVRALSAEGALLAQSPVLEFRVAPSSGLGAAWP